MSDAIRAALTAPVKLVIWDLDETFWNGTLSEGGVTLIEEHIQMVRTLVDRGIMCSVCSRNDMAEARAQIEAIGIWDLFVFPHIARSPKGQAIAAMLQDMGLRAENALFVDDNALNLQEALYFNEGLMVWECTGPITDFLSRPEFAGTDDRAHDRLEHFKKSEARRTDQMQSGQPATYVLRQSEMCPARGLTSPGVTASAGAKTVQPDPHVLLLGDSDLRQIASTFGPHRTEFVNRQDEDGRPVRYDDVGFFLNPRDKRMDPVWQQAAFVGSTLQEMRGFDSAASRADILVLSMYPSVATDFLFTFGGAEFGGAYWGTIPQGRMRALMQDPQTAIRFAKSMHHRRLPLEHRLSLTRRSLTHADTLRREDSALFVLGAGTTVGDRAQNTLEVRTGYNDMARDFCTSRPGAHFVDMDALLAPCDFVDSDRYTRTGHTRIADFIQDMVPDSPSVPAQSVACVG